MRGSGIWGAGSLALVLAGCLAQPFDGGSPRPPRTSLGPCEDPGRVTLHRLNAAEYDNTVRDLLGDDTHPARDFPADDHGYGFDNIADVLATSPLLVEKYDIAAENLVAATLAHARRGPRWHHFEAEDQRPTAGARFRHDAWILFSAAEISATASVAAAGEYEISARASARPAGPEPARLELRLDGQVLESFDVTVPEDSPQIYRHRVRLEPGEHALAVAFANPYHHPEDPDPEQRERSLIVDWLELGGPFDLPQPPAEPEPARYARVMICDPGTLGREGCAREIFARVGRRAFRRPLAGDELARLLALAASAWYAGDPFEDGIGLGMQAMLTAPSFLFRVELDPDPQSIEPHALDEYALASRLSYFLWSSMPDDRLFELAAAGQLSAAETLAGEVRRMLADPRSAAFVENFAGQWLLLRGLADANPDYALYPSWDEELETSMEAESYAFFQEIAFGEHSARELLDADFAFVNERLARHYGYSGISGTNVSKVELSAFGMEGARRRGVLGQGSILTVTSHPRRTSPVKRGKWVLEQLLCSPPPPPPPGVAAFPEQVDPTASLRERFEQHRSAPTCRACHAAMDPIGFGLENFDAIGAWRDDDSGFAIDASGELPTGESFDGPRSLAAVIEADPALGPCIAEKVLIYALGRGPTSADSCAKQAIDGAFVDGGLRFEALFEAIVASPLFRERRGDLPGSTGGP